mgnify:CR=1 FL=1
MRSCTSPFRSFCTALFIAVAIPILGAEGGWQLRCDGRSLDWQPIDESRAPTALMTAWSHPDWAAGRWLCDQAMPEGWRRLITAPFAAQRIVIAYRQDSVPAWRRWTALHKLLAPWSAEWRASDAGQWRESGQAAAVPGLMVLPQEDLDPTALLHLRLAIDGATLFEHLQEVKADALLTGGDRPLTPDGPTLCEILHASRGLIELQVHPGTILPRLRLQLPASAPLRQLLASAADLPLTQSLKTVVRHQLGLWDWHILAIDGQLRCSTRRDDPWLGAGTGEAQGRRHRARCHRPGQPRRTADPLEPRPSR